MGTWGIGSDENDDTYDYAGFDIVTRITGAPKLSEEAKILAWDNNDNDAPLGYIIMLIKAGCVLPPDIINNAIHKLKSKKDKIDKVVFEYEIILCKEALQFGSLKEIAPIFGIQDYAKNHKYGMNNVYKDLLDERKKNINI